MTSGEIWDVRLPRYWMRCRLYSYLQLTSAKCLSIVIKISRCDLFHFRAHNRQILLSMVTVFIEGKNCAINFVIIVKIPIVSRSKNRIWIIPSEFNGLASCLCLWSWLKLGTWSTKMCSYGRLTNLPFKHSLGDVYNKNIAWRTWFEDFSYRRFLTMLMHLLIRTTRTMIRTGSDVTLLMKTNLSLYLIDVYWDSCEK